MISLDFRIFICVLLNDFKQKIMQARIIFQLVMKSHQDSSGGDKEDIRFFHETINYEYVKECVSFIFCLFYIFWQFAA